MIAKHRVNNFEQWKQVYDDFASTRKERGVTGASVHRDANDSNMVFITHQFKDLNAATAFANSEELKSTMAKAGVAGPPDIWFTNDVEQTPY
jgi:quinol monooxygenase YgiN